MRPLLFSACVTVLLFQAIAKPDSSLWYTAPAQEWNDALPIGNGFIGAMIFGRPGEETLQINEDSLFSGGFRSRVNQNALDTLPRVRELLAAGRATEAEQLALLGLSGTPPSIRHYETLGEIVIDFDGTDRYDRSSYRRWLDLETALAGVNFTVGGTLFQREMFASNPDRVIAQRFTATGGTQRLSFNVHVQRTFGWGNSVSDLGYNKNGDTIYMVGGTQSNDPIGFATGLTIKTDGNLRAIGEFLVVENATEATAYFAAATTYRHKEEVAAVEEMLAKVAVMSYNEIRERHIKDYQSLQKACTLELSSDDATGAELPTDRRLNATRAGGKDPGLVALQFQYGRYMLISSSREGSLPANLQGIWNKDYQSNWGSKFTVNINLEMNYWPSEVTNLPEMHHQFFDLLDRMHETGKKTANSMYGASGWMSHHNTDLWGDTAPQDRYLPATYWTLSSAWLSTHILEHFWYTGDQEFLQSKLSILSDAIQFYLDTLQEHQVDGVEYLVTNPSVSPENVYKLPGGSVTSMAIGPSCDFQILRELFLGFIDAVQQLDNSPVDSTFIDQIQATVARFPPQKISTRYPGVFQEWIEDFEEAEPGHRHISHLFALHPGTQVPPPGAPGHNDTIWKAARRTLEYRLENGGAGTGWSRAWALNWFARLLDGEALAQNIFEFFTSSVYNNLFDAHPPFQADGNFGFTAAVAEALLQSHVRDEDGVRQLWLLPALPASWPSGNVTGLVARGGFVVDMAWGEGQLTRFKLHSRLGQDVALRFGPEDGNSSIQMVGESIRQSVKEGKLSLKTERGSSYEFEVFHE